MIKATIKSIHAAYVRFRKKSKWRKELKSLDLDTIPSSINEFKTDKRILVLAPHADDELIGCYQLIKNHYDTVTVLYCSFLGSNYSDSNKRTREKEFVSFVQTVNCDYIISSPDRVKEDIRTFINQSMPEFIFLPSVVDWQHEHRKLNNLCNEVVEENMDLKIGWYHVSLPIPIDYINSYSLMSNKDFEEKWAVMNSCYTSQLHMDIERFRFVEKSIPNDNCALETYSILTIHNWKKMIANAHIIQPELNALKECLGNMKKMFCLTNNIYRTISTK